MACTHGRPVLASCHVELYSYLGETSVRRNNGAAAQICNTWLRLSALCLRTAIFHSSNTSGCPGTAAIPGLSPNKTHFYVTSCFSLR